jgi:hypothetical protein
MGRIAINMAIKMIPYSSILTAIGAGNNKREVAHASAGG